MTKSAMTNAGESQYDRQAAESHVLQLETAHVHNAERLAGVYVKLADFARDVAAEPESPVVATVRSVRRAMDAQLAPLAKEAPGLDPHALAVHDPSALSDALTQFQDIGPCFRIIAEKMAGSPVVQNDRALTDLCEGLADVAGRIERTSAFFNAAFVPPKSDAPRYFVWQTSTRVVFGLGRDVTEARASLHENDRDHVADLEPLHEYDPRAVGTFSVQLREDDAMLNVRARNGFQRPYLCDFFLHQAALREVQA